MKEKDKKDADVRGMRNSIAAMGRSLELHCRPMSGYVCLKLNQNAMSVQLKVCAVNSVGLCILTTRYCR